MTNIDLLISEIKRKRELSRLDNKTIKEEIDRQFKINKNLKPIFDEREYSQLKRSKEFEQLFKTIRKNLRKAYGMFQRELIDRETLLNEIKNLKDLEGHKRILETHQSTTERLPYYDEIYKKIFAITGQPESILDLGCGLNPFSYPWLNCEPSYYASDISPEDTHFIDEYFEKMDIDGEATPANLNDIEKEDVLAVFPHVDACFMFKVLDAVVTKPTLAEKLITSIDADWIVVSFSTVTLSGKPMTKKRRLWIEKMSERLGYQFQTFQVPNEIFYLIRKT